MLNSHFQLHENDRKDHAQRLGLSLERFDSLLESANKAFEILTKLGPFYGQPHIKEPTFRVTADPVLLPKGSKQTLENLGNDLLILARALKNLPPPYQNKLSNKLEFNIPPSWRIDAIIDNSGNLKVNEIEGQDGASALMIAEQLAYRLQRLDGSTAAQLIPTLHTLFGKNAKNGILKIALIRVDNPHNTNADKFIGFVEKLSGGKIKIDHIFDYLLREGKLKPDWNQYAGVISESSMSPKELVSLGIEKHKIASVGNYNAIVNKGVFALLHDSSLFDFWLENLGEKAWSRLKNTLIHSKFVESETNFEIARGKNKVIKAYWADENTSLINRSRGVAIPQGNIDQSSEERWKTLKELLTQGVRLIEQDFVIPAKISSYLRKKGTTLESVNWYNRVCIKYVVQGDPNAPTIPSVSLTATEVTLGPNIIPAGRECAFTAGIPR